MTNTFSWIISETQKLTLIKNYFLSFHPDLPENKKMKWCITHQCITHLVLTIPVRPLKPQSIADITHLLNFTCFSFDLMLTILPATFCNNPCTSRMITYFPGWRTTSRRFSLLNNLVINLLTSDRWAPIVWFTRSSWRQAKYLQCCSFTNCYSMSHF